MCIFTKDITSDTLHSVHLYNIMMMFGLDFQKLLLKTLKNCFEIKTKKLFFGVFKFKMCLENQYYKIETWKLVWSKTLKTIFFMHNQQQPHTNTKSNRQTHSHPSPPSSPSSSPSLSFGNSSKSTVLQIRSNSLLLFPCHFHHSS